MFGLRKNPPGTARLPRRVLIFSGLALALLAAAVTGWGLWQWSRPGPLPDRAIVLLQRGKSVGVIAARLEQAGVIRSATQFSLAARLTGASADLKAGEYEFAPGQSLAQVMAQLRAGRVLLRRVTIPEGLTVHEIRERLKLAEGIVARTDAPDFAEGALLPETYQYVWGDTDATIMEKMRRDMTALLDDLWQRRRADLPVRTKDEAVVLASIVEKETGVAAERPLVASVFLNRMRLGMPMQSDPTVIYGITQGGKNPMGRALTFADLRNPHPWNTYVIAGLPPTPIANPGRASLEAVLLHPADTEYLYFVADGTGGHAFARTLAEHNRNVARWREINR